MLQIISGKFFESNAIEISDCKGILYSNFYWILPIETCIGTLEPVDIFNTSSISPYVINYQNKLERLPDETTVRTGDAEIINQFKLLSIFGLKSFFEVDRNSVELLCRKHPKSSTEKLVPSSFVPRFFDYHIHGKYEEVEHFKKFIQKTIGLPREKYLAVINSINAFSQSLQTLNYNLDLAYSLLIYSLESLSQRFDKFDPTWEDYDLSIRKKLEKLFEKDGLKQSTVDSIQDILLKSDNLRIMARFIDFTSENVSDSFFKEEANGLKAPLRKSELKQALKNAYKMRSSYVHKLGEVEESVKISPQIGGGESIRWENKPYLTFSGLTRLVHHVICNFIQDQEYLEKERYYWRQDLPGRYTMNIHPKHWIWNESIFNLSDINITFSGFLSILEGRLFRNEELVDLRKLMLKIENLVNSGLRDELKSSLISFYFLYNEWMNDDFKSPNYDDFMKNYTEFIYEPNIENMIAILLLNKKWPWDIKKSVHSYLEYKSGKFNKNSLSIPNFFDVSILINIANEFLEQGNKEEFKKWLGKAILELPGKLECQNVIEEYKSKDEKIIILDTLKDCLKDESIN